MTAFVLPARSRRPRHDLAQPLRRAPRRARPEETLQMQVVKYLGLALAGRSEFFAVPNGGKRGFREAQRFKAAGVKAGVPDLIVINDGRAIGIELKAGKTPLSDVQRDYHERLRRARVAVTVCRSVDEVEAALRAAGVPLHATLEAPIMRAIRPLLSQKDLAPLGEAGT